MAPRADPKAALLSRYASDGYQPPAAASNRIDDDDLLFAARKQVRHSGVARGLRTLPSESTTDDVKTGSRRDRLATTAPSQRPSSSMVQWKRAAAMVRATYSLPAPSNGLPRRLGGAPSKASQKKGTSAAGKLVDVSASSPYATALNKMASPEYTSRYTDPKSIWAALQTEDVQLVSLKWLLERGAKKKPLPRRQALPPEAKMSHKRLAEIHARSKAFERIATARQVQAQVMPIIAVSHAWLTVTHPDPHADNLVTICKALKTAFWDHKMEKCFEDVGVFLDWCSLYQEHGGTAGRTPEQQSSFKRALNSTMDLWYSHQMTSTLFVTDLPAAYLGAVTPYSGRGWPSFERRSSQLIKRIKSFGSSGWTMCVDSAMVGEGKGGDVGGSRQVPYSPVHFAELLETKTFTNGADKAIVSKLYARVASAVLASTKELNWDYIPCAAGEGVRLGATLALCHHVERLSMKVMGLTDVELAALCEAISSGMLPKLRELALHDNQFSDEAASTLASALHRGAMPALTTLALLRNHSIGPVGRATLNAAAASCKRLPPEGALKVSW